MYVYHTARRVAMTLRVLEVALRNVALRVSQAAGNVGSKAKAHAEVALQRQEDKAFEKLLAARSNTEKVMESLLDVEDILLSEFEYVTDTNADLRQSIAEEIL